MDVQTYFYEGSAIFSLAVAPHPSGRNRFWNRLEEEDKMAFKRVLSDIKGVLETL
ncbi:MAG: hypothetical protein QXF59_03905 [Candidatus Bathyarchaeia archaeon]